jgi:hypothetical protein
MTDVEHTGLFSHPTAFLENGRKADREVESMEIDHMPTLPEVNVVQGKGHFGILIIMNDFKTRDIGGDRVREQGIPDPGTTKIRHRRDKTPGGFGTGISLKKREIALYGPRNRP